MNKLALALTTAAIAAAASSTFVTTAEAGRGHGHRFHFRFHHFQHHHHHAYRQEEDYYYARRRRPKIVTQVTKPVAKPVAKSARPAVAKYVDGQGRQFDLTSKVWFDGKNQCWRGDQSFVLRGDSWFYGNARWVETSSGWGVSSGKVPQQVSCDGIQAFAAKIQQAQARANTPAVEPAKVATVPATPASATAPETPARATAPETSANARECKKYFPSVGEMVSVPCTE